MQPWWIYQGIEQPHDRIDLLPAPPKWRVIHQGASIERTLSDEHLGFQFFIQPQQIDLINAAIYLRRPMLVEGKPGSGKSTLARAIAYELKLGSVLTWPITSRSTLHDGLYHYDAIARLHDASLADRLNDASLRGGHSPDDIGQYITLGPLGTSLLPAKRPRVLLIDEIDKSDIDLPSDLLHVFERGEYEIPELKRIAAHQNTAAVFPHDSKGDQDRVTIERGQVACQAFPIVVMTSNHEREFPPAFLRRCMRITMPKPGKDMLKDIITSHLDVPLTEQINLLVEQFLAIRTERDIATDQLLNAVFLLLHEVDIQGNDDLRDMIFQQLSQETAS